MATIGGLTIGVLENTRYLFCSMVILSLSIGLSYWYKSKFVVAIEWIFAFFLNKRGTRLIYRENLY